MRSYLTILVGSAAFAVLTITSALAQKADPTEVDDHSLSEWKLGEVISGTSLKLEDLKGKVVAIEKWGIN